MPNRHRCLPRRACGVQLSLLGIKNTLGYIMSVTVDLLHGNPVLAALKPPPGDVKPCRLGAMMRRLIFRCIWSNSSTTKRARFSASMFILKVAMLACALRWRVALGNQSTLSFSENISATLEDTKGQMLWWLLSLGGLMTTTRDQNHSLWTWKYRVEQTSICNVKYFTQPTAKCWRASPLYQVLVHPRVRPTYLQLDEM